MDKRYKRLNGEERGVILAEHRRGASLGAIEALLGHTASTIGRELRRGRPEGNPAQPYCAQLGADRYRVLRGLLRGLLRRPDGGLVGDLTTDFIEQFKVDYAIIGTLELDHDGDLLDFDLREVRMSRAIIRQSRGPVWWWTGRDRNGLPRCGWLHLLKSKRCLPTGPCPTPC